MADWLSKMVTRVPESPLMSVNESKPFSFVGLTPSAMGLEIVKCENLLELVLVVSVGFDELFASASDGSLKT